MVIIDELKKKDFELKLLAGAIVLGVGILLAGLWYVQIARHEEFSENLERQTFRTVRIPAMRGKILDRNRKALARNEPRYQISLYLEEIREQFQAEYQAARAEIDRPLSRQEREELGRETRYRAVRKLVGQLKERLQLKGDLRLDKEEFTRHYKHKRSQPLPVLSGADPAVVARFEEQPSIPAAFELEIHPSRVYPHNETAAHVLGYLQRIDATGDPQKIESNYRLPDFKGVVGLEATFDEALRGKAGIKSVMVNSLGYRQSENVWEPSEPGRNLILTLDLDLQQAAEEALRSVGPNPKGAVVVMDPDNGDLLALVSLPSIDPNRFIPKITASDWQAIQEEPGRPQINRATAGIYPPGSVFKPVVGLACLEAGVCDPSQTIRTHRYYRVGRRRIMDEARPGIYDFYRAFKRSSNYYFIEFGLKAGWRAIVEMGERFHLGEATKIPIRQENTGFFPNQDWIEERRSRGEWTEGHTANLCLGQGEIAVTPLQVAGMVSAMANGGKLYWPRLAQRLEPQDRSLTPVREEAFPPRLRSRLQVDPKHLEIIHEAMHGDVKDRDGTGRSAAVPGLEIGGKTGTAESSGGRKITWFVSFAPVSQPEYVIVVMVEDGVTGGETAAPVAKQIYESIVRDDPPSHAGSPPELTRQFAD